MASSSHSIAPVASAGPLPHNSGRTPTRNFDALPEKWRDAIFHMIQHMEDAGVEPLKCADIFSGTGNMAAAFGAFGMLSSTFEKQNDPEGQDVTTDKGMGILLYMIARVEPGGIVWLGPPCSSWVWLSRSTTKRSASKVEGDTTVPSVAEANAIANIVADIMRVCHALGVFYVVEQPRTSLLFDYSPMRSALDETTALHVALNLGQAGATSQKPLTLWGTAPWLRSLAGTIRRRPMLSTTRPLTDRRGGTVNGRKAALSASASYPRTFCCIVARLHAASIGHVVVEDVSPASVVVEIDSD